MVHTGNTKSLRTNIPSAQIIYVNGRDFVRQKRANLERITAPDVLQFLITENITKNPITISSVVRCVQRWLLKNGFKRGKKFWKIVLAPHVLAQRNNYLLTLLKNRNLETNYNIRNLFR